MRLKARRIEDKEQPLGQWPWRNCTYWRNVGLSVAWLASVMLMAASAEAEGGGDVQTEHVPLTIDSRPFFGVVADLTADGYREDEYFVSGNANVYEYDDNLDLQLKTANVPYKSRILIRRPEGPARFNGILIFELMNPTAGFDIDFEWHFMSELLLKQGYIWVGITMRDTAVDFLKFWDPTRYESLSMLDRGQAYEMYAQVAALLRDPYDPENPIAAYDVHYLIGTGYSQSADYLTTFSNEFHEQAMAWDGRHAFDGYLHAGGGGAARLINSEDDEFYLDERRFNRVSAPLMRVQSETELAVFTHSSAASRQPDSSVFRVYEVAGASHADEEILTLTGTVISRELGVPILPGCDGMLNPLRISPVHRNSLVNLVRWIARGDPPPPSQLIEIDGAQNVSRDAHGNALGGVRLPPVEAPLGTFAPYNSGPGPCILAGTFQPFNDQKLDELYPNHGTYLSQVRHAAARAARLGYLLPRDARTYIVEAARSRIGR